MLVKINLKPTDRQLRQFGVIALVALPLVAWIWSGAPTTIGVAAGVGAVLAALGWCCPKAIQPVYLLLSLVAIPIGIVLGEVLLAVVFFGLFVPMGLVFKLIGRDALQRKFDPEAETYWQPKHQPTDPAAYLRQW